MVKQGEGNQADMSRGNHDHWLGELLKFPQRNGSADGE